MIRDIVAKHYVMTKSSRAGITHHRMYRAAMRNDRRNTKSAFFILSALYHKVAKPYQDIVQRKFGSTAVEDRLGSYLAFYPNTVVQNQADATGEHAARFKTDYPNVRNIPYWVHMGLPEPDIVNCRPLGTDPVQSEESAAFMVKKTKKYILAPQKPTTWHPILRTTQLFKASPTLQPNVMSRRAVELTLNKSPRMPMPRSSPLDFEIKRAPRENEQKKQKKTARDFGSMSHDWQKTSTVNRSNWHRLRIHLYSGMKQHDLLLLHHCQHAAPQLLGIMICFPTPRTMQ
ncbi:hypothetical protein ACQKWADRAFT_305542 [Trichoderma austrokoningii]